MPIPSDAIDFAAVLVLASVALIVGFCVGALVGVWRGYHIGAMHIARVVADRDEWRRVADGLGRRVMEMEREEDDRRDATDAGRATLPPLGGGPRPQP